MSRLLCHCCVISSQLYVNRVGIEMDAGSDWSVETLLNSPELLLVEKDFHVTQLVSGPDDHVTVTLKPLQDNIPNFRRLLHS